MEKMTFADLITIMRFCDYPFVVVLAFYLGAVFGAIAALVIRIGLINKNK